MVPGLVKGMYVAWKKYGKLPWSELLQPSVELAIEMDSKLLKL